MADAILAAAVHHRRCKTCGEVKCLEAFEKSAGNRGGYTPRCKECLNAAKRKARADRKAQEPPKPGKIADGRKKCRVCATWRSVDEFRSTGDLCGGGPATCNHCEREKRRRKYGALNPPQPSRINGDRRQCLRCLVWKTLDSFYAKKHGLGNRNSVCKVCMAGDANARTRAAARTKEWAARHPTRAAENAANANRHRRARKKAAPGTHTGADIRQLFKLQRGTCAYCPTKLHKYHVDHVMPLARGGSNGPENLQLLCPTCNLRKGARHPLDFARMIGKLL